MEKPKTTNAGAGKSETTIMASDKKPLVQQWWFWTAIGVGAIVLLVLVASIVAVWRRRARSKNSANPELLAASRHEKEGKTLEAEFGVCNALRRLQVAKVSDEEAESVLKAKHDLESRLKRPVRCLQQQQ